MSTPNATVSAGVVVCRKDPQSGKVYILFVQRPDGFYAIPSGHLEPGETLQGCACREFREETGHLVMLTDLLGVPMIEGEAGGPPSIGFIFFGLMGERIGEPEGKLVWMTYEDVLMKLRAERPDIFLSAFNLWAAQQAQAGYPPGLPSLDLIPDHIYPR